MRTASEPRTDRADAATAVCADGAEMCPRGAEERFSPAENEGSRERSDGIEGAIAIELDADGSRTGHARARRDAIAMPTTT
jgi:hypothetical protein